MEGVSTFFWSLLHSEFLNALNVHHISWKRLYSARQGWFLGNNHSSQCLITVLTWSWCLPLLLYSKKVRPKIPCVVQLGTKPKPPSQVICFSTSHGCTAAELNFFKKMDDKAKSRKVFVQQLFWLKHLVMLGFYFVEELYCHSYISFLLW